jgi:hypothetical protein
MPRFIAEDGELVETNFEDLIIGVAGGRSKSRPLGRHFSADGSPC